MEYKVGFIGCGNMAKAMIKGIVLSNICSANDILVSNPTTKKLKDIKNETDVQITQNNKEVASFADILILAVKPNKYIHVINEIKDKVKENVIIVTIAAGITIDTIKTSFNSDIKVIRTMPNTPAMVNEGMTAMCSCSKTTKEDLEAVAGLFNSFGKVEIIEEKLMDVIPALSGSSPAYVYMFIEALADGAVLKGMNRDKAYKMAAQAVLGSAKMVLNTGKHPAQLKDEVCSPGGTTIEAVYALEKNNFRGAIIEAVEKCTNKAINMSRK